MTILKKDEYRRILVNCSSVFDVTAVVMCKRSFFFAGTTNIPFLRLYDKGRLLECQ